MDYNIASYMIPVLIIKDLVNTELVLTLQTSKFRAMVLPPVLASQLLLGKSHYQDGSL